MAAPGTPIWESDSGDKGEIMPSSTCKGSHVSVVNMDASWGSWQQRICTGEVFPPALLMLCSRHMASGRASKVVAMRLQYVGVLHLFFGAIRRTLVCVGFDLGR